MLTLNSPFTTNDCTDVSRRDFVRWGSLALGGLSLSHLLQLQQLQAATGTTYLRDRAIVLLFLSGGASHIETFDPKLDRPGVQGSMTGEVRTSIPGITFGGTFPELAKRADQMAIVRSFQHSISDHVLAIRHVLSGGTVQAKDKEGDGFSMGAALARIRGANHQQSGFPTHGLVTAEEIDNQYSNERARVQLASKPGALGANYAALEPTGKGEIVKNLRPNLELNRIDDRRQLLQQIDRLKQQSEQHLRTTIYDDFEQQAWDLILGSASSALDLSKEDPRLVKRYDTSHISVGHKKFQPSPLGKQLLLARRMCEAGAGFVTVHCAGWDMHNDSNNPGIIKGMNMLGRAVDHAVAAFLDDLQARGLDQKITLVITGDFGRTPKINNKGGRDHWSNLGTLAFAGAGINAGQVIGQSDRTAAAPASDPVTPANLFSSLFHLLFDVGQLRLRTGLPRDVTKLYEQVEPIPGLISS